ncbi:MAG: hypothetical protein HKN87_11085 [Saprospiraceae bacterium]|nr:hypothetical protein [Saprospiraceae bacterium]
MLQWILFVIPILCLNIGFSQVHFDFSSEMNGLEGWSGDTADFTINVSEVLQLSADGAGESALFLPLDAFPATWKLDVRLDFDPSASNRLRLYLVIDDANLTKASGYFLALGAQGNADVWSFYRVQDGQPERLGSGNRNLAQKPSISLEVQLKNDVWTFWIDDVHDFEITEPPQTLNTAKFCIACKYSETRKDKFFFDNLTISPTEIVDTLPPELVAIDVLDERSLTLHFSERLDSLAATIPAHYGVAPALGSLIAVPLSPDHTSVMLTFATGFINGQSYRLTVHDLEDEHGNEIDTQTVSFEYLLPQEIAPHQVLINEIYDDPTPSQGIPESEYIEIYIAGSVTAIDASELIIRKDGRAYPLPKAALVGESYYLLCNEDHVDDLSIYGDVLGVKGFPTLRNSGNALTIETVQGILIHTVQYDDSWFGEAAKEGGGWSLELINPRDPCALNGNWAGSISIIGGTPGEQNSIWDTTISSTLASLQYHEIPSATQLNLIFDKKLGDIQHTDFHLTGGEAAVVNAQISSINAHIISLEVAPTFLAGIDYSINISQLNDCENQPISYPSLQFRLPDNAMPGDLLINEILFNPVVGGSDFVEIYNGSDKTIRAGDLYIANVQGTGQSVAQLISDQAILPGAYFVISENPEDIVNKYTVEEPQNLMKNDLPALDDDAGNVTLYTVIHGEAVVIDVMDYDKSFHTSLLKKQDGVSLERISTEAAGNNQHNWHSAAASVGHATPTASNSQQVIASLGEQHFELIEKVFSPDGDGFQDVLAISYQFLQAGTFATTKIFDSSGRLTKVLTNNLSLATNGLITWDGTDEDGRKSNIGIYTILLEAFNLQGTKIRWKETCVMAGRLN